MPRVETTLVTLVGGVVVGAAVVGAVDVSRLETGWNIVVGGTVVVGAGVVLTKVLVVLRVVPGVIGPIYTLGVYKQLE